MAKLSKVQKYAIQWLNSTGLDIDSIAKELNITTSQISALIPDHTNDSNKISAKNLMITHTSGKKINSVAIMTKEASEIADEAKKKPGQKMDDRKGIFRPKK